MAALTSNEETDALLLHMDSRELWIDGSDNVTEDLSILQTEEPFSQTEIPTKIVSALRGTMFATDPVLEMTQAFCVNKTSIIKHKCVTT